MSLEILWNHSFRTYAKFTAKQTFLPPYMNKHVEISGGKRCYFFGETFVHNKE